MSLSYTDQELKAAEKEMSFILSLFKENYLSKDRDIIDRFGARNVKLKDNLPGAIGYFIGYKIVESYVNLYGEESWRDVYNLTFEELLDKSEFLSD